MGTDFIQRRPLGNWLAKNQLYETVSWPGSGTCATGRLLDIGCGEKPYKQLFAPFVAEHVGVDHPESPHALTSVDVLATAYEISLDSGTFDTALMSELLEHLEEPQRALAEAFRLLKPNGVPILTTPFIWVIHEEPRDFYRYTPFALEYLLKRVGFEHIEVSPVGGQWATVALLTSYALRRSAGNRARHVASFGQRVGRELDRRQFLPWMAWNHVAVARKPGA